MGGILVRERGGPVCVTNCLDASGNLRRYPLDFGKLGRKRAGRECSAPTTWLICLLPLRRRPAIQPQSTSPSYMATTHIYCISSAGDTSLKPRTRPFTVCILAVRQCSQRRSPSDWVCSSTVQEEAGGKHAARQNAHLSRLP